MEWVPIEIVQVLVKALQKSEGRLEQTYLALVDGNLTKIADDWTLVHVLEAARQKARPATAKYERPVPDYGTLYTVAEWLENVDGGWLIDYDGHGYAVKAGRCADDKHLLPSQLDLKIPLDATHVVWFNR